MPRVSCPSEHHSSCCNNHLYIYNPIGGSGRVGETKTLAKGKLKSKINKYEPTKLFVMNCFWCLATRYIPKLAVSYVHSPKYVLSKTHTHPVCCRRGSKCFLSFISKMKRENKLLKNKRRNSHGE